MRIHLPGRRSRAWKVAVPVACVAVAVQLALANSASATPKASVTRHHAVRVILPKKVNDLDCNGWSPKYQPANSAFKALCADPLGKLVHGGPYGGTGREPFYDNGHYVGHDEPSVKFISSRPGSGNTMTYFMRLPVDPKKAPTASGSVVDYAQLTIAPWFGLPICDPRSYPQLPCKPDSDSNKGGINNPYDAGSAFLELQLYAPGFTPFTDSYSCSKTQWCAALTIDSLECTYGFASCNPDCPEPVNFSYLQTNGVPPGPPAPEDPDLETLLGNAHTLKMNPGDVLKISISDPRGGLVNKITDLTTGRTGWIQASAKNGFANTNIVTCAGTPFTFHAEYSTAKVQNQVPWAALEGGVLMEQEVGHSEVCNSVARKLSYKTTYAGGGTYDDPDTYQTCMGGSEGKHAVGEGPCNVKTGVCDHSTTQGPNGPVACPDANYLTSPDHCEFADAFCFPKGNRTAVINGKAVTEYARAAECHADYFQNGDLDFDGLSYQRDWPDGNPNYPTPAEYIGPFTRGHPYSQIQFETDIPASEQLCDTVTGAGCTVPPRDADFYPFWSLNKRQVLRRSHFRAGYCVWNFGTRIPHVTTADFGGDKQYGKPHVARYGGTSISAVHPNPALRRTCT
jgi:hypothetical protein